MSMQRFTGKVILVTGAARGIGLATATEFAREGGVVYASDIDKAELEAAYADIIAEGLTVITQTHDVVERGDWDKIISLIIKEQGRLDVLFNNAGIGFFSTIEDTTSEQWQRVMRVNVESVFLGMQTAIAVMKNKGGVIVNMASIAANVAEPLFAPYNASKGGVHMLTKAAAVDCARKGYNIRINSIHPGYTETKLVGDAVESLGDQAAEFTEAMGQLIPVGRLATPYEIARPVLFMASDDASYMVGASLVVDGGYTAP